MQPYSDYEIAQRRIAERRANKSRFQFLLALIAILVFITLSSSGSAFCTVPIGIIMALFAVSHRIEMYYTNPEHAPTEAEIEKEMEWLFCDDWQEIASAQAYALAQDRIRKRRMGKWGFLGHFLLYIPVNCWIIVTALRDRHNPEGFIIFIIAIWIILFIAHARSAFPTKQSLEKREINFGKTLHFELARLQPEKAKAKEKLKRGKYYQVGDDGELEEVEDEIVRLEEKPKRSDKQL